MNRKLNYKPSKDEERIFDECMSDCFWYRSVPAAGLAGAAVLTCIKTGKIQSSKYGSVPKVLAASGIFSALTAFSAATSALCFCALLVLLPC